MKTTSLLSLFLLGLFLLSTNLSAQIQKKEQDFDLIYEQGDIQAYDLPRLLELDEGKIVEDAEVWMTQRRPQILSSFSNLIYGRVPVAESPIETTYHELSVDDKYMEGKATRKVVRIGFKNKRAEAEMKILVISPNNATKPAPALMQLSFDRIDSEKMNLEVNNPEKFKNGLPIGDLIQKGFAYIAVYQQDVIAHNEVEFRKGIHQLYFKEGQSFPKANEWGVIAAISWSASRALDYLQTVSEIDARKVALMGHSKLGKATLWAVAQDQRFALAISAQSGCGGAALWRRKYGETLAKISVFPYWLCTNSRKFINNEHDLPVDQHMMLALIAPRPLYVSSAESDTWADPRGEYVSAYHASEVYELLGKKGLMSEKTPEVGKAILEGTVGYHIRKGGHSVKAYDWEQYLAFMELHLR